MSGRHTMRNNYFGTIFLVWSCYRSYNPAIQSTPTPKILIWNAFYVYIFQEERCLNWTLSYQIGISWGVTTLDQYFMSEAVTRAIQVIQSTPTPHISIWNVLYGHIHQELRWLHGILSYQISILWEIATLDPSFGSKAVPWTFPAIQSTPIPYILIQNV